MRISLRHRQLNSTLYWADETADFLDRLEINKLNSTLDLGRPFWSGHFKQKHMNFQI